MSIPVVGLGAGGHAKVLVETLRLSAKYRVAGLLDSRRETHGTQVCGVPVLGDDSLLAKLGIKHFFLALAGTGEGSLRQRLFDSAVSQGLKPIAVIHPSAVVSPSAQIGPGVQVLAGAILNTEARLGVNVIVNTGAIVEHDCLIGDHVHVATGARLCGGVRVENLSHIGAGAIIRQGIHVGASSVVGAGSVVVKPVEANSVVAGVPARPLSSPQKHHHV